MREELKNFEWHLYGLDESDLDYAIQSVENIIADRERQTEALWEKNRNENPDVADDIMDDVAYYKWVENQYLWTFCLWRMQGIFEGLITTRFLQGGEQLIGLARKLDAMVSAGYRLDNETRDELIEWARLRNALSHCPPEKYKPPHINLEDIQEYRELLRRVLTDWTEQFNHLDS